MVSLCVFARVCYGVYVSAYAYVRIYASLCVGAYTFVRVYVGYNVCAIDCVGESFCERWCVRGTAIVCIWCTRYQQHHTKTQLCAFYVYFVI